MLDLAIPRRASCGLLLVAGEAGAIGHVRRKVVRKALLRRYDALPEKGIRREPAIATATGVLFLAVDVVQVHALVDALDLVLRAELG